MSKTVNVKLYHNTLGDKDKCIGEIPVKLNLDPEKNLNTKQLLAVLETVYARTQNVEDSWGKRYGLGDQRSTSVGDYMIINGNSKWYVADVGFTQDPVDGYGNKIMEVS